MISKTELQYVSGFARNVPYPGNEYAKMVMDKLIEAYNIYEEKYRDKNYSLILSNGEEFEFSILPKNLCHMLGIDYKNIISDPMRIIKEDVLDIGPFEQTSSFDILSRIIERKEEVIKNDSNCHNYKLLNYYKILIKSSIFAKLSDFTSFNFGCINFSKYTFQNSTNKSFAPNSTKLIFTPSDEALIPYFMIGMMPDNGGNVYIPETLFATPDFQNFFINQELVVPIQLLINDKENLSKIVATSEEKLNILKMYRSILQSYKTNSFINIYNDYETVLKNDVIRKKLQK